ncbi:MAG: hypothetical protein J4431_02685 [Candidatus Aenigmarchaeota archaeon]|nr:hypothetical protein [Candidatus Aenigmarchaeota archaeon]
MVVRIEIRKDGGECIIISFRTNPERFSSDYERIAFFRKLHGWKQTVPRNGKNYEYRRNGLLDSVPHEKIADSVFLVAKEHMRIMEEFFREWEEKVDYDIMDVVLKARRHGHNNRTNI